MLSSATPETFNYAFKSISDFISNKEGLKPWMVWWYEKKNLIFRVSQHLMHLNRSTKS